ncbi:unnamed protein product [Mytilus coruscus]|uniref:Uncharacterized protein n=1 Tax=Mytilus coruscus TaxID=42192 RepID=A0A6J7ZYI3_MYTCO|nr:unnamed protein product [Mytilus coruscus]
MQTPAEAVMEENISGEDRKVAKMSEELRPKLDKFKHMLHTGSHSPCLSKNFAEDPQLCLTLDLTCLFVKEVEKTKSNFPAFSYVDIINSQLHAYQLVNCDRLENRFFSLRNKVNLDLRTKYRSGRKRQLYKTRVFKVAVFQSEIISGQGC